MKVSAVPKHVAPIVERLVRVGQGKAWYTSCYLKLEPRDRARRKYLIKLKNRIKQELERLEALGIDRNDLADVKHDLSRIRSYLENSENLPQGQGIALFACRPRRVFEAIPLPEVFRSRLTVDRTPLVRELAAVSDEFGLLLCAVADRTEARFFLVTALGVEETQGLKVSGAVRTRKYHGKIVPSSSRGRQGSYGEHNFQQRIKGQVQRHLAEVAGQLFELSKELPLRGLVLAGPGGQPKALSMHLHPYLQELLLGWFGATPRNMTPDKIWKKVIEVRRRAERARELRDINLLMERVGDHWAVNGTEAALRALARGQVNTLVIDGSAKIPGYKCSQTGRLTTSPQGCRGNGTAEPVADVIDDAIEEALKQGCRIQVIEDGNLAGKVEGLAALLRFRSA